MSRILQAAALAVVLCIPICGCSDLKQDTQEELLKIQKYLVALKELEDLDKTLKQADEATKMAVQMQDKASQDELAESRKKIKDRMFKLREYLVEHRPEHLK
jgi:hypothetical protein